MKRAKKKIYNKNSSTMGKDMILVTDNFISNTFYCVDKNYYLKNLTIDSKIDKTIELKEGCYMLEGNHFTERDYTQVINDRIEKAENSDVANITKIDIDNKFRLCFCAERVVFIDSCFAEIVEEFEKVTYKDGIFYCSNNNIVFLFFTEIESSGFDEREYSETFAVASEFLKGMIPNVILKD